MDVELSFQGVEFGQPRDSRDVDTRKSAKIRGAESITREETQKPLVKAEKGSGTRRTHWNQGKRASKNRAGRRVRSRGDAQGLHDPFLICPFIRMLKASQYH